MTDHNENAQVHFEDMCWPNVFDPTELTWKLLHAPESISRGDMFICASYIGAYQSLIFGSQNRRNILCKKIKYYSMYSGEKQL